MSDSLDNHNARCGDLIAALANNTLNTDREGNQARLYSTRIADSQAQSGRALCISGVP